MHGAVAGTIALTLFILLVISVMQIMQQEKVYAPRKKHVWKPRTHRSKHGHVYEDIMIPVYDGGMKVGEVQAWRFQFSFRLLRLWCSGGGSPELR